jgi:hypothetical protein
MSGKNTGKLLSLNASGTIGDAFTYSKFKSCGYVKKHSHPTETDTAAALAARERFRNAAWVWKNIFNGKLIRDAWQLFDDFMKTPQVGYTAFVSQAIKLQKMKPDGAFVKTYTWAGPEMTIDLVDVKKGLPATEPGQFEIWIRIKDGCWILKEKQTMIDGKLDINLSSELRYASFMKIVKDGLNRSGSIKLIRPTP